MDSNELERESLMRRNGSNALPLSDFNSRHVQFQQQVLSQPTMQQNQQPGSALQQWRMGLNQQPQRFPQTIPGAMPITPIVYTAQTRPPTSPFVDSDATAAAAALAAARNRISQNQPQNQRSDPPLYSSGRPDTSAASSAASSTAAAVLARVRQQQQQGIPNPQPANPQPHHLQPPSLADDRWKGLNSRPQLGQPLHLPSVRPPTTMLGPQMPTPFPSQVPPPMLRPPFPRSPPPPNRPSLLNDQPRIAALMAEYNNRMASAQRPSMMPTDFGMPRPMMPPRQTLPVSARPGIPPVFPVTTIPGKPIIPPIPTGGSLPTNLTVPSAAYASPRPVLPNFTMPVNLPGSLPTASVPSGLLNLQTKPQISMGWPETRIPPVHPGLVRSNSAPPIHLQPYFSPVVHFSQVAHMPDIAGISVPMMTYPLPEGVLPPDHSAPVEGCTSQTLTGSAQKVESKEECGASSCEVTDEELKRQRPLSADSMVRRCGSASHGDAETDGHTHRRHQSAWQPRSGCSWAVAAESMRSRHPDDVSGEDARFLMSDTPVGAFHEPEPVNRFSEEPNQLVEYPPGDDYLEQELVGAKASESSSRAVVISEYNRHGAIVDDTVETMSDDGPTLALSKHRKVAAQRNLRRRVRPSLSNNALTHTVFGPSSPAVSSAPELFPNGARMSAVHFEVTQMKKIPSDDQACGEHANTPRLPFCVPSFFPPFPRACVSVVMSLQYAKLIIVLGLVLPLSELLSPYIRPYSYQAFYLYLYLGSILFMVYMNISAVWRRRVRLSIERRKGSGDACSGGGRICQTASRLSRLPRLRFRRDRSEAEDVRYGSVYLRIGVNAFGIGSMVYCGLEIAHEIEQWTMASSPHLLAGHADRPVRLLLPACRAVLTILQMHFILFNDKASEIRRQTTPARIGLAHMIATNVCEWLGVVVQETRHEIIQLNAMGVTTLDPVHVLVGKAGVSNATASHNSTLIEASEGIVGPLLHTVAPFLSPCTIEYSLICAVLLFEMWKEVGHSEDEGTGQETQSVSSGGGTNTIGDSPVIGALANVGATGAAIAGPNYPSGGGTRTRGAHHLSADLTHSQRGAFGGVLLLVLTLLGVALLSAQRSLSSGVITDPGKAALVQLPYDAVLEATLSGAVLLGVVVMAVATRHLAFDNVPAYPLPLDLFLLVAAQTSAYVYSLFVIIGCYVLLRNAEEPVAVHYHAGVIMAVEALSTLRAYAQTHIIVRVWHRRPADAKQATEKPGRQAVTFLLFANICLWAASTFGSARAQRLPHHMRLFGVWPWTAIAHACLPLTIFLHLHSSICLFEVWKNCYKFRPD